MAAKNRFSETHGIVGLTIDGDWNAGFDSDSVDMSKYNHCCMIIMGDANVAGNAVLTLYGGATAGAKTAAATFCYRYSSADVGSANSDVFTAAATSAALTSTAASVASQCTLIEFDASDLLISGTQYRYATLQVSADGSAGTVDIVAILSEPRYIEAIMDTGQA
jgi:hypothetical protein